MLAPFATLALLATLWLVAAVGAEIFLSSGWRIVAALRGEARAIAPQLVAKARSIRAEYAPKRRPTAWPHLRAAA